MKIRKASMADVFSVSDFLTELAAHGKRRLASDQDFVRDHYVTHADNIQCSVAEDIDGVILGLQILKVASYGNVYDVTPGWGIIGTHVRISAARRGVGKALFVVTRQAAKDAGLKKIDASIGATNASALAFYDSLGFLTYRTPDGKICKCFKVPV